jgi:PE family
LPKLTQEELGMSFVTTQPEALSAAATNLQGIGSAMSAQNSAAAAPTTGVVPAAADEVSALTAAQFAAHAQLYQAVSAQAAAIHEAFVNTLGTSAGSYATTEAANAAAAG